MNIIVSKEDRDYIKECLESGEVLKEDLRRWFKEKWVDVSKKVDGKHPPCGRKDADGKSYPKCRPSKKVSKETPKVASSYSKKEKKSMTTQKRRAEKKNPKQGKGNTPTFTRYDESINEYMRKNTPIEENRTITLNFDTITETNTHIKLNSNHGSKIDISEGLKFHIATNKSIIDNVYKKGTDNFNNLLEECRDLYMNGDLELSDDDLSFIMENTNNTDRNSPTFTHFNEDNISKITNLVLERLNSIKKIIYEDEFGSVEETDFIPDDLLNEAEYQGRKVKLNKPFLTPNGPKKRSVYVKNEKGNVIKVNFGDPNMRIKKYIPSHRKSFRARHHCETAKDKKSPRYWSCKFW